MTVNVRFLPDNVTVQATAGEPLLNVAARAGIHISTGCLMGSCHACEVEMTPKEPDQEDTVLACLTAIPKGVDSIEVDVMVDPTW